MYRPFDRTECSLEIDMARRRAESNSNDERQVRPAELVVRSDELLYAIPDPDDPSVSRYFVSDEDAAAFFGPDSVERALALAGAWADLDWDYAERELYRIGHSNPPSPILSE